MHNQEIAIEIKNLKKIYGEVRAVDDLSLTIEKGIIFGLLGPNGAGKTTTLEILEGLRKADSGEIQILGMDPARDTQKLRKYIGIQLQSSFLSPLFKAGEMIELYAAFYGLGKIDIDAHLNRFDLLSKKKSLVKDLSGGQKQRLALAVCMIHDPEILFLDEPTVSVDPQNRQRIWEYATAMRAAGKTVVISTHLVTEAEAICDRVAIMDLGQLITIDTPKNLIAAANLERGIEFNCGQEFNSSELEANPLVDAVKRIEGNLYRVVTKDMTGAMNGVLAFFNERQIEVENLNIVNPTLEDVFISLTGRSLRE